MPSKKSPQDKGNNKKSKIEDKVGKRIKTERLKKVKLFAGKNKNVNTKLAPPPSKDEEVSKKVIKKDKIKSKNKPPRQARLFFWVAIALVTVLGFIPAALIIWPEYINLGTDISVITNMTENVSDSNETTSGTENDAVSEVEAHLLLSEMVGDLASLPFDFKLPASWHVAGDLDMLLPGSKEYGIFLQVDARPILSGSSQSAILQGTSFANGTAVDVADSREEDLKVNSEVSNLKRAAVSLNKTNAVRLSYAVMSTKTKQAESFFEYYIDDIGHNLSYYFKIQIEGVPYFEPFTKNLEFASLFEESFKIVSK